MFTLCKCLSAIGMR